MRLTYLQVVDDKYADAAPGLFVVSRRRAGAREGSGRPGFVYSRKVAAICRLSASGILAIRALAALRPRQRAGCDVSWFESPFRAVVYGSVRKPAIE